MKSKKKHVMFVCTEDWFFRSHFLPLNEAALSAGYKTSLLCNAGEARKYLEDAGLEVLPVSFSRERKNPLFALKLLKQLAGHFLREKPDIIHFISLKPMMVGGLAALSFPKAACVYHLTGLGYLTVSDKKSEGLVRSAFLKLTRLYLKKSRSWLVIENPDDLQSVREHGSIDENRLSIFGGAGVDPEVFSQGPNPENKVPVAAFVGRMVWSKGVDILVEAMDILKRRNVKIRLDLYGTPDDANPRTICVAELKTLSQREDTSWHGRVNNLEQVWAVSDFSVVPSRGGEGLPRSLLEAASCGRPLVVTDVPGNRYFVRDGVEGFVIPPEDAKALADAMEKLIKNPDLRKKMGYSARQRVLDGFTEQSVKDDILKIYRNFGDV